ncbi:MAG: hypothetical protein AB7O96_05760 [Pseudobdellovibrionaceae bacterium]
MFNGRTIQSGSYTYAYNTVNSVCYGEVRVCNKGVLSGSYAYSTCGNK